VVRRSAALDLDTPSQLLTGLDLFAKDAGTPSLVKVAAKAYRNVALTDPGEYTATLKYYNGSSTVATWLVRNIPPKRKAKNVVLFIGDGMTTNMITGGQ
jgi:alkaline phosphatase